MSVYLPSTTSFSLAHNPSPHRALQGTATCPVPAQTAALRDAQLLLPRASLASCRLLSHDSLTAGVKVLNTAVKKVGRPDLPGGTEHASHGDTPLRELRVLHLPLAAGSRAHVNKRLLRAARAARAALRRALTCPACPAAAAAAGSSQPRGSPPPSAGRAAVAPLSSRGPRPGSSSAKETGCACAWREGSTVTCRTRV